MGSFVTTQMDLVADELMNDGMRKNIMNHEAYPAINHMHQRCVHMIGRLFNVPKPATGDPILGTSTVGSSEAILLGVLAMKRKWADRRRSVNKDCGRPNMIMSSAAHVCWKKAALYFDIEQRVVFCSSDRFTLDPEKAVELIDENTIGICSILGTTYTGEYENTKALNDLLVEKNLDVPIHVDAASGGFVAPFLNPDLIWDFRLEKVSSINVSGHKYGLVYAGAGWIIWRDAFSLPTELIFEHDYLGTPQVSINLNFSRSASSIVAQYYNLIRLGKQGYRRRMYDLRCWSQKLASQLERLGSFIILSKSAADGLPFVVFRLDPLKNYRFNEFDIAHELRLWDGWVVPAYRMAPHGEEIQMLRVVVREDFDGKSCEALVNSIGRTIARLLHQKHVS